MEVRVKQQATKIQRDYNQMAWNFAPSSSFPTASLMFQITRSFVTKNHSSLVNQKHLCCCKAASPQSEGIGEEHTSTGSSTRAQLDLLQQLTSSSSSSSPGWEDDGNASRATIREQLFELDGDKDGDFSLRLGKKLKASLKSLTISQKRNIKRQSYLNEVDGRNDSVFFATIRAFVILPPILILSIAVLTGYVQLFP